LLGFSIADGSSSHQPPSVIINDFLFVCRLFPSKAFYLLQKHSIP